MIEELFWSSLSPKAFLYIFSFSTSGVQLQSSKHLQHARKTPFTETFHFFFLCYHTWRVFFAQNPFHSFCSPPPPNTFSYSWLWNTSKIFWQQLWKHLGKRLVIALCLKRWMLQSVFYMKNKLFALNSLLEENGFTFFGACKDSLTRLIYRIKKIWNLCIKHLFYYCFRFNGLCNICKYCTSMIYGWNDYLSGNTLISENSDISDTEIYT